MRHIWKQVWTGDGTIIIYDRQWATLLSASQRSDFFPPLYCLYDNYMTNDSQGTMISFLPKCLKSDKDFGPDYGILVCCASMYRLGKVMNAIDALTVIIYTWFSIH